MGLLMVVFLIRVFTTTQFYFVFHSRVISDALNLVCFSLLDGGIKLLPKVVVMVTTNLKEFSLSIEKLHYKIN